MLAYNRNAASNATANGGTPASAAAVGAFSVIRKRLPDESLKITTKRVHKYTVGVIIKTKTL